MKKSMLLLVLVSMVCSAFLFMSCEKPKDLPKVFIGSWGFDPTTFQSDPRLKQMLEDPKAKASFEVIAKAFESLSVKVTASTFAVEMAGAQGAAGSNKEFQYKVTDSSDTAATLVNKSGGTKGGKYKLEKIDENHIKMINLIQEDQPMTTLLVRK
jgi:hypothetical protein